MEWRGAWRGVADQLLHRHSCVAPAGPAPSVVTLSLSVSVCRTPADPCPRTHRGVAVKAHGPVSKEGGSPSWSGPASFRKAGISEFPDGRIFALWLASTQSFLVHPLAILA